MMNPNPCPLPLPLRSFVRSSSLSPSRLFLVFVPLPSSLSSSLSSFLSSSLPSPSPPPPPSPLPSLYVSQWYAMITNLRTVAKCGDLRRTVYENKIGSFFECRVRWYDEWNRYVDDLSFVMMIDHRRRSSHTIGLTRALYLFYTPASSWRNS